MIRNLKVIFFAASLLFLAGNLYGLITHWCAMNRERNEVDDVGKAMIFFDNYLPAASKVTFTGNFTDGMDLARVGYQSQFYVIPRIISFDTSICDTFLFVSRHTDNKEAEPALHNAIVSFTTEKYTFVLCRK